MIDPHKVKSIFLAAAERPSTERTAYLNEIVADDVALRERVEALLAAHDDPNTFLDQHAAEFGMTADLSPPGQLLAEGAGTIIGPYKLLQQIGEGGMGVVFMAEQSEPIQRNIALKIIKPGMDTRQVIARFEAERQALAMMDHPNIAKVFDAGTTASGRPYFVMELVKGVPITKYCDEKQLPIRARLELLLPVCQAVQHAHQKGVIHRDIKPTNVLVAEYDDQAVPKVIDFGVAKATAQKLTDRTMFTEFGQVVGTVEYMSPEQAKFNQLDIDTRSDIYSLGVLLYELLTGSTPFGRQRLQEAAFDEALRIIREEDPQKPSTRLSTTDQLPNIAANRHSEPARLSNDVRGELDWIVMKALEKDRNRRYETANGLARDVERYLHDEPVQACPPSATYRFRKFARRNKAALLAATAAMVALLLLVIGLVASNRLISTERDQKAEALKEKEQALAAAKTSEAEARTSAQHATAESKRAEESFLHASIAIREVLTKAAMGQEEWSQLPSPLRKRLSDEAVNFYNSLLQQNSTDPDLEYETAVGYRAIGAMRTAAAELSEAEESYRRSIAILERLVIAQPANRQYRQQLAWSLLNLGRTLRNTSRTGEAKTTVHKGIELYETLLSEDPNSIDYRSELATCYLEVSNCCQIMGDLKSAEDASKRGVAILKTAIADKPDVPQYNEQLAGMQLSLGRVCAAGGRVEAAKAAFHAAAEHYETAFSKRQNAGILYNWSDCFQAIMELPNQDPQKRVAEAERAYHMFLQVQSRTPDSLLAHRDLRERYGHGHRSWAFILSSADRRNEAEAAFVEGAKIFDKLTVDEPSFEKYWAFAADTHLQIASLMVQSDRNDEAQRELSRAIDLYDQIRAKFPKITNVPERAEFCNRVAWLLVTLPASQHRNPGRAVELAKKAVELDPEAQLYWNTLGVAQYRAGQWQPAVESLEKSMSLPNSDNPFDWFFLAMADWQLGQKDEARRLYDKSAEWMDTKSSQNKALLRFRAEASELLGITPAQPSTDKKHADGQPAPPQKSAADAKSDKRD